MSVYRTQASLCNSIISPRWNVTRWRKWYVRIARLVFDLREPYKYQREYNQYRRDLQRWNDAHINLLNKMKIVGAGLIQSKLEVRKRFPPLSPMPVPPPVRILE